MAKFDADTLRELRDIREVAIRTEKHPATAVIIWVVLADKEVFVRSVRGSKGRWYRDLATGGFPRSVRPVGEGHWDTRDTPTRA